MDVNSQALQAIEALTIKEIKERHAFLWQVHKKLQAKETTSKPEASPS